jgi:N,N'-diacetyllegionaminate synthase
LACDGDEVIVEIGGTRVGPGEPVYVIAEIGSNHDGSIEKAYRLIEAAADADADAAKFQFFRADRLYPGRVTAGGIPDVWLPLLRYACHEAGVEFLCSVFDLETLAVYGETGPAAVKIASPEAVNVELLTAAAGLGVPVLVSTGAMTLDDVMIPFRTVRERLVLLHCVAAYPSRLPEMNLGAIPAMARRFRRPVGLSDHSLDPCLVPVVAATLGACVVEKHLTLDRRCPGADHVFALEPGEFRMMVDTVRNVQTVLGDGVKRVQPSEDTTDRRAA